jgi:holo-[acyl-carrier protein] synthase
LAVLGVGVDAVDIDRFRRILARRPTVVRRLFTIAEQDYAGRARDPAERLAARFAAKEAALKALGGGIGSAPFSEIEVVRDDQGAPGLALHGDAARLASDRGVERWHLSITHTADLAVASAVAEGRLP